MMAPADEPALRSPSSCVVQRSTILASGLKNELRSTSAQSQFARSIAHPEPGDRSYIELIRRKSGEEPRSYRLTAEQIEDAEWFTRRLAELRIDMDAVMERGQPKPEPLLRIRPKY